MGQKIATTIVLLALSCSASFAADMAKADPAPAAPAETPAYTWTGAYVGAYAGGATGWNGLISPGGSSSVTLFPGGFTGGGLAGFNYQVNPFVLGIEGEFGVDAWKQSGAYTNARNQPRNATSEGTYAGRIRARVGYAAGDFLFYGAGGVSFADDRVTESNPNGNSDNIRKDLVGWNAGAGVEYAFSQNWTGRFEYIYDNYGRTNYDFSSLQFGFSNRSVALERNTFRVGVAYKF
ncbi:opacity protein-like surface antigen [Rhizobium aquaticum]|uniref:Opacity protein-like surface antigen n=1 Tax=Rhizobium aquaticum TaxID=1549636 RepID=A0ABV2IT87_9HYPH